MRVGTRSDVHSFEDSHGRVARYMRPFCGDYAAAGQATHHRRCHGMTGIHRAHQVTLSAGRRETIFWIHTPERQHRNPFVRGTAIRVQVEVRVHTHVLARLYPSTFLRLTRSISSPIGDLGCRARWIQNGLGTHLPKHSRKAAWNHLGTI